MEMGKRSAEKLAGRYITASEGEDYVVELLLSKHSSLSTHPDYTRCLGRTLRKACKTGNKKIFDAILGTTGILTVRTIRMLISDTMKSPDADMLDYVFRRLGCLSPTHYEHIRRAALSGNEDFVLPFKFQPAAAPIFRASPSTILGPSELDFYSQLKRLYQLVTNTGPISLYHTLAGA